MSPRPSRTPSAIHPPVGLPVGRPVRLLVGLLVAVFLGAASVAPASAAVENERCASACALR